MKSEGSVAERSLFVLGNEKRKTMTKIEIVSGFLGAGKTTLIKKLLSEVFAGTKVVLIENCRIAFSEELFFPEAVFLKAVVLRTAYVVGRKICENCGAEMHVVNSVGLKTYGGYLYTAGLTACIRHNS